MLELHEVPPHEGCIIYGSCNLSVDRQPEVRFIEPGTTRHKTERGLHSYEPAVCGRATNRAAGIGTQSECADAGRHGTDSASRGSAWRTL